MSKMREVKSRLEGSVRCTDGTVVVFVPMDDDGQAPVGRARKPKKPAPAAVR